MDKEVSQKMPAEREPSSIDLYSVSDPIPVAEAVESDTDAVWGLWENSLLPPGCAPDADFESIVPAVLTPLPANDSPKRRP